MANGSPSEIELSYAAGIVDGEGTIGITELSPRYYEEARSGKGKRRNAQFRGYVSVVMTDFEIPMLMHEWFGGSVRSFRYGNPKHNPIMRWHTSSSIACDTCRLLLPFLRLKKRQAELVIQLYEEHTSIGWPVGKGLPPDEITARRELTRQAQALNQTPRIVGEAI